MNSFLVLSTLLSCLISQSSQLYEAGIGYNAYGIGGVGYNPYGAGRGIYGSPTLSPYAAGIGGGLGGVGYNPYGAGIPGHISPVIYGSTYGAGIGRGGLGGAAYNPHIDSPILSQDGLDGGLGGAGYIPYEVAIPRGPGFGRTGKTYAIPLSSSKDVDTYSAVDAVNGVKNGASKFLGNYFPKTVEEVTYIVDEPFNNRHGAFFH